MAGAAAALVLGAWSPAPGLSGDPSLPRRLAGLVAAVEPGASGTLHVLFSASCRRLAEMWEATRPLSGRATIRWIPYGGRDPRDAAAASAVLADPTPAVVAKVVAGGSFPPSAGLSARQDEAIDAAVAPLLFAATGRPLALPTTVYATSDGTVRVMRGALDGRWALEAARAAAS